MLFIDDQHASLADCLTSGRFKQEELDGNYWWTFDLTQTQKEIKVIPASDRTGTM